MFKKMELKELFDKIATECDQGTRGEMSSEQRVVLTRFCYLLKSQQDFIDSQEATQLIENVASEQQSALNPKSILGRLGSFRNKDGLPLISFMLKNNRLKELDILLRLGLPMYEAS